MAVHVPAAHGDTLLAKVGTLVILLDICRQVRREPQSPCTNDASALCATLPTKDPNSPAGG